MVAQHLTDEWRACQMRLGALERQYAEAMTAYVRGEGPPPPDELLSEVLRMRKEANHLLTAALREIDRRMHEQNRKLDGR